MPYAEEKKAWIAVKKAEERYNRRHGVTDLLAKHSLSLADEEIGQEEWGAIWAESERLIC